MYVYAVAISMYCLKLNKDELNLTHVNLLLYIPLPISVCVHTCDTSSTNQCVCVHTCDTFLNQSVCVYTCGTFLHQSV
jgi:hypothetical protein